VLTLSGATIVLLTVLSSSFRYLAIKLLNLPGSLVSMGDCARMGHL
jgi:hypothetical protein